jgi:hypothetical protein
MGEQFRRPDFPTDDSDEATHTAPSGLDVETLARAAENLHLWLIQPNPDDIREYSERGDDWDRLAAEYARLRDEGASGTPAAER